MKDLRNLSLCLTLICALAAAVFAGETGTPPCAPGELQGPPCPAQSVNDDSTPDDSMTAGQANTPPSSEAVDVVDIAEAVMWALSLF